MPAAGRVRAVPVPAGPAAAAAAPPGASASGAAAAAGEATTAFSDSCNRGAAGDEQRDV